MMFRSLKIALLLPLLLALPRAANAAPIFDFSSAIPSDTVTDLGPSEVLSGGITAYAYYLNAGTWTASTLIGRNEGPVDAGLGVCSEPSRDCAIGGTGSGDWNELSQLVYTEAILLQRPAHTLWNGLWVSSLDDSGIDNPEKGRLYWGDTNDIAALRGGEEFDFEYPEFGALVYGKLTLPGTFDPSAEYVLFVPGGDVGDNNDYLVWGADLQSVPEPGTLALMGSALCALAYRRRRSNGGAE